MHFCAASARRSACCRSRGLDKCLLAAEPAGASSCAAASASLAQVTTQMLYMWLRQQKPGCHRPQHKSHFGPCVVRRAAGMLRCTEHATASRAEVSRSSVLAHLRFSSMQIMTSAGSRPHSSAAAVACMRLGSSIASEVDSAARVRRATGSGGPVATSSANAQHC